MLQFQQFQAIRCGLVLKHVWFRIPYSQVISGDRLDVNDVIQPTRDEINKQYGRNENKNDLVILQQQKRQYVAHHVQYRVNASRRTCLAWVA